MNILLFDIDGVLIDDRGYRAGIVATVNLYSRIMGQGDRAPNPAEVEIFHAHGYTNEWDICPFAIGALIVSTLRAHPDLSLTPAPLDHLLPQFQAAPPGPVDYGDWVTATRGKPGRPSERARSALSEVLNSLTVSDTTRSASLSALAELLNDPYDFSNATVTQVFQEHALGSSVFEEVYRRRPRYDIRSLLYDEDRAALNAAARATLLNLMSECGVRVCVYTARPSLPPADILDWLTDSARAPIGFSPEAELGLQLIELSDLPLIAMGRMQWLAARVGSKVEYLTKPAPIQALAAIIAAITRRESEALLSAYRLVSEGALSESMVDLQSRPIEVWVIEDATIGVHAAAGAVDLLQKQNVDVTLHALGISAGGPNAEALTALCEAVFPTVNESIAYVADRIRRA